MICEFCWLEIEKWEEEEVLPDGKVMHDYCADALKIKELIDRVVAFKKVKRR